MSSANLRKVYVSKLNPMCEWFWQTPKPKPPASETDPWYQNMPVGINTLSNKMKTISKSAKCSKLYTNHCLRSTCITTLDQAGFETRDIMAVSGHRSETSIKTYTKTSDVRKKEMSEKISRQLNYAKAPEAKTTSREAETSIAGSNGNPPLSPSHNLSVSTMPQTRTPLMELQIEQGQAEPLASSNSVVHLPVPLVLSSHSNCSSTTTRTSHSFNIHDCVVNIHNH